MLVVSRSWGKPKSLLLLFTKGKSLDALPILFQLLVRCAHSVSGYRHVYLEGMEEASIFVHVAINDICGKVSACPVKHHWHAEMSWQEFVSHEGRPVGEGPR